MSNDPRIIIDDSPMTVMQVMAVSMCILLTALDGFDVLSISFAAPGIADDWGINRAALGVVLSMELIGMAVGSIALGNLADRIGRRPTIMLCLIIMSIGMFFAGGAQSLTALSIHRFYTGLGIGGMLASTNAMTAEFANKKHRNLSVILMAGGYPLGVIIGGSIASYLLVDHSWRSIFYLGSAVTIAFLPLVWFILPESIAFLINKGGTNALSRINATLSHIGKQTITAIPEMTVQAKASIMELFRPRLLAITVVLTIAYFMHIMTLYFILKWIPKIVVDMGFAASKAGTVLVWANVGGLTGSVLLGLLSSRFSVRNMLFFAMVGSCIMVTLFGQAREDLLQLSLIAAIAGFFVNAGVVGLYALFAQSFPANVRAGGTGFVIGVGRGGAALSPIVAGLLFVGGYGLQTVALLMGVGSLIAAIALIFLKNQAGEQNYAQEKAV